MMWNKSKLEKISYETHTALFEENWKEMLKKTDSRPSSLWFTFIHFSALYTLLNEKCGISAKYDPFMSEHLYKFDEMFDSMDDEECALMMGLFSKARHAIQSHPEKCFIFDMWNRLLQKELHIHEPDLDTEKALLEAVNDPKHYIDNVKKHGFVSISDHDCTKFPKFIFRKINLVKDILEKNHIDWKETLLFVGVSDDPLKAFAFYTQLAYSGIAGVIVVNYTPELEHETEYWFTPTYFTEEWSYKRLLCEIDDILGEVEF